MSSSSDSSTSISTPTFSSSSTQSRTLTDGLTQSRVSFDNLDTFLSSSSPSSSYVRQNFSWSDPSFQQSVRSLFEGKSFRAEVPSALSSALEQRSDTYRQELSTMDSDKSRSEFMSKRAKQLQKALHDWSKGESAETSSSGGDATSSSSPSILSTGPGSSDSLSPASSASSSPSSSRPSSNETRTRRLSGRSYASTTEANLKPQPPSFDAQTVQSIISFIRTSDRTLDEDQWWTAYHALRSPSGYGKQGVPAALAEMLLSKRALQWDDVKSSATYERERARTLLGDENLAGSHLQGYSTGTESVSAVSD